MRVKVALFLIVAAAFGVRVWYASYNPSLQRFEDERYAFQNVRPILAEGSVKPLSGYYPSPVFTGPPAATMALADAASGDSRWTPMSGERFSQSAVLIARLWQTLWGVLAVWLAFLIGRRLFESEGAGLLAALILGFMPKQIHASGYFKPDALLVMAVLLSFWTSLRAMDSPTWRRYAVAGASIAIALSAKLTGGVIAVPLTLGTLVMARRDPGRLMRLALAGATSLVVFLILNPYGRYYLGFLSGLSRDYAKRAAEQGASGFDIPFRLIQTLTDFFVHGALLGTVAILAMAGLLVAVASRRVSTERRVALAMFVSFPLAYTLIYAMQTSYYKANNFLPVTAFTSIALGGALIFCARRLATILPATNRGFVQTASVTFLVALIVWPGWIYVYRSLIPTTFDIAFRTIERSMSRSGRIFFGEEMPSLRPTWERTRFFSNPSSAMVRSHRVVEIDEHLLDRSDGEIFPLINLERDDSYRQRWNRVRPRRAHSVEPSLFRVRGPAMVALMHAWRSVGPPVEISASRCTSHGSCYAVVLPAAEKKETFISISFRISNRMLSGVEPGPATTIGDVPIKVYRSSGTRREQIYLIDRIRAGDASPAVHIGVTDRKGLDEDPSRIPVTVFFWDLPTPHLR